MNNVRAKKGICDFEKVLSMEGIYLANVYDEDAVRMFRLISKDEAIKHETVTNKKTSFRTKNK